MKKHLNNQSGFSLIEALLMILVIAVIGFCGYFVYHSQKSKTASASAHKTTGDSAKTKTVVETQYIVVRDNQKYLNIKEWGVIIPIDDSIDSVVYTGGHYDIGGGSSPDDARLGLLSLGSDCSELPDASSAPLGWYVRFTKDDVNAEKVEQVEPGSTSLHELVKTAVKIPGSDGGYGAYYVAYAKPTSDCSNGENMASVNAATATFEKALNGIKSDN
jgi:hypothetical protein